MNQQNKFNPQHEQELSAHHQAAQNSVHEFKTVDELLKHDAARSSVPASIAERLQKSSAGIPKPPRSLWQRLFGD
jgi:hypothetical protein